LLDEYLTNRLAGEEKSSFEKKLASDPELKREYSIQQSLISGIKQARAKELKSMLNNIPTAGLKEGVSNTVKIISGITTVALVAVGVYFFTSNQTETSSQTPVAVKSVEPSSLPKAQQPVTENNTDLAKEETTNKDVVINQDKSLSSKAGDATKSLPESVAVNTPATPSENDRKISVYDPSGEDTEEKVIINNIEKPSNAADDEKVKLGKSTIVVETDNTNKKYTFHYQFKNSRLFLFGKFEKNLYEILEFFTDSKRTIFLFYQNNYYLLDEAKAKPTPLTPITDGVLLDKLKEYRND
jgi:hypothetical protein